MSAFIHVVTKKRVFAATHMSIIPRSDGTATLLFLGDEGALIVDEDELVSVNYYSNGKTWCRDCGGDLRFSEKIDGEVSNTIPLVVLKQGGASTE